MADTEVTERFNTIFQYHFDLATLDNVVNLELLALHRKKLDFLNTLML